MSEEKSSLLDWIIERLLIAFVSTILAALTLFIYPLVLHFFVSSHGSGGGPALTVLGSYYKLLFSKLGILVIVGTAVFAFFVGSDRMVSVLSFFWGTHPFWTSFRENIEEWHDEHFSQEKMLGLLIIVFVIVLVVHFV